MILGYILRQMSWSAKITATLKWRVDDDGKLTSLGSNLVFIRVALMHATDRNHVNDTRLVKNNSTTQVVAPLIDLQNTTPFLSEICL